VFEEAQNFDTASGVLQPAAPTRSRTMQKLYLSVLGEAVLILSPKLNMMVEHGL
jgi:hypothetical protein